MRRVALALLLFLVCARGSEEGRFRHPGLGPSDDPDLLIGIFRIREDGVVDGDTLRVDGLKKSLRLLHLDTEETYRRADPGGKLDELMRTDFAAYVKRMSADRELPAKYATPLGDEATRFAKGLLPPGTTVRLERDVAGSGADAYGRTLCHVWVVPGEGAKPWHYGAEAMRAGMSPYFIKYGRSRRFDAAFRAAQEEARKARRGIWSPDGKHYPDYETRLAWWGRRADALDAMRAMAGRPDAPTVLGERDAIRALLKRVGKKVRVFGLVDDHDPEAVRIHPGGVTLRVGGRYPIEIELTGSTLIEALDPKTLLGEFIVVEGSLDQRGSPINERTRYMRIPVTGAAQLARAHKLVNRAD